MKKYKISLTFNIIVFILVTIGTIFMMSGIKFMGADDIVLTKSKLEAFKFFTVDSNVLMGIAAIIFAYYDFLVIKKKEKEIPKNVYVFKHIATVGVLLTFLVTVFYLAPFSEYSFFAFFKNSNLFFHLIVPILSVVVFVFYERKILDKKVIIYGVIPMAIYSVYYVTVYLIHLGSDSIKDYDWYGFMNGGVIKSVISLVSVFLSTYIISYSLWVSHKK